MRSLALLAVVALSGCSFDRATPATPAPAEQTFVPAGISAKYIKHVVIVVQENRSFDNIFAGFPGADAHTSGTLHTGVTVPLEAIPFEIHDMSHDFATGVMDFDHGKMDQFDLNQTSPGQTIGTFAYSYLQRSAVAPY